MIFGRRFISVRLFFGNHSDVPESKGTYIFSRPPSLARSLWPLDLCCSPSSSLLAIDLDLARRSGLHVTRFRSEYCAPIRNSYIYEIYANCGIISRRHFLPPHGTGGWCNRLCSVLVLLVLFFPFFFRSDKRRSAWDTYVSSLRSIE